MHMESAPVDRLRAARLSSRARRPAKRRGHPNAESRNYPELQPALFRPRRILPIPPAFCWFNDLADPNSPLPGDKAAREPATSARAPTLANRFPFKVLSDSCGGGERRGVSTGL